MEINGSSKYNTRNSYEIKKNTSLLISVKHIFLSRDDIYISLI